MKKIRSKIILIFLIMVLLPLIPISLLVYQLVNQSYRIGVNPEVQTALEEGITISRMLYDSQRGELMARLEKVREVLFLPRKTPGERERATLDSLLSNLPIWTCHDLQWMENGSSVWKLSFTNMPMEEVDPRILQESRSSPSHTFIASDRRRNLFTAVLGVPPGDQSRGFLVLRASLQDPYLEMSDHLLQVNRIYQSLDRARESLVRSFLYTFVLLVLVFLTVVVAAGVWLSGRITRPISQLVKATAEIGKGNLDYQLPVTSGRDEIGRLMGHFNQMTRQLKENQERLVYLEKMSAWQQMARKMAHEIKNPLTPIQLTVRQLVDSYRGTDQEYRKLLGECADIIQEEIDSLRNLVNEFSRFGRLPELAMKTGNLNELITEISALYGSRLQLQLDEQLPRFAFDPDRMRRILLNLIENAIQADPQNRPVRITTGLENHRVVLEIRDEGMGIAEEVIPRIFEPYFSTRKKGTGLGLAITRLMVEEHHGTIRVHSRLNQGSTFIIELPIDTVH